MNVHHHDSAKKTMLDIEIQTHAVPADQAGRRISLLGTIDAQPAILLVERAAFSTDFSHLDMISQSLGAINILGANDIYSWFLASSGPPPAELKDPNLPPDLKLNLIYPCTQQHITKYSAQGMRMVSETPEIYRDSVRPYMEAKRAEGRLNWVYNIIEGRTEQEDVIYRNHSEASSGSEDADEGFLLLPDLNWDRKTQTSLHVLGIVERRDIWSVRDLSKTHIPWLKSMQRKLITATTELYKLEPDQLKLYVHYQPTYYHFHIHVVHVMSESGATQAAGKALLLQNVISQLETMSNPDASMADVTLEYGVGEASELWLNIFEPMKKKSAT